MLGTTSLTATTLTAAAVLGLTLLTPASAGAAGETCQGQPATIVGTPGQELEGTEGPDVIVTNGATDIKALGGGDLICVTGSSNPVVEAGAGDDVVTSTLAADAFATFKLGAGSDQFTGSAASDVVYAGDKRRRVLDDTERDVIDGGPSNGEGGDYVVSGEPDAPNGDVVRVAGGRSRPGGSASTVELQGVPTAQASFDGGGGSELKLDTAGVHRLRIDAVVGRYTRDGSSASFTGFDDYTLEDKGGPRRVVFRGSGRSELLTMAFTDNPAYTVEMAGGDDEVVLETNKLRRAKSSFSGGHGHDQMGLVMLGEDVRLDLRRNRLIAGEHRHSIVNRATGFEDAEVVGKRLRIVGTRGDNDIRAYGCNAVVRALGGDDKVSPLTLLTSQLLHCRQWARFEGGRGNDLLVGDAGVDVLIGGPGRDIADGGSGRDICSAEKVRRCEVRR